MQKFFRHYKGKPYKLIGTAKFSESLEDMTVYETLYDNPEGKLWVRPKAMFDEVIEKDGKLIARFQPIQFTVETVEGMPDQVILDGIVGIANKVLNPLTSQTLSKKINAQKKPLVLVLLVNCR